jgi:hypothetical protein
MGASPSVISEVSKAQNPNGKSISIIAELCSSWGYNKALDGVVKILVGALNNEGYDVNYTVEPKSGGKGEYYIYKVNSDETKKIVFSNNRNLHASQGAFIGSSIRTTNVNEVVKNILKWFIWSYIL